MQLLLCIYTIYIICFEQSFTCYTGPLQVQAVAQLLMKELGISARETAESMTKYTPLMSSRTAKYVKCAYVSCGVRVCVCG